MQDPAHTLNLPGNCLRSHLENSSPSLVAPSGGFYAPALIAIGFLILCPPFWTLCYSRENAWHGREALWPDDEVWMTTWSSLTPEKSLPRPVWGPSGVGDIHSLLAHFSHPIVHLDLTMILRLPYIRIFNIFSSKCSSFVNT